MSNSMRTLLCVLALASLTASGCAAGTADVDPSESESGAEADLTFGDALDEAGCATGVKQDCCRATVTLSDANLLPVPDMRVWIAGYRNRPAEGGVGSYFDVEVTSDSDGRAELEYIACGHGELR